MTQTERRKYLIRELLREQPQYRNMEIPESAQDQKSLLRSLFNIRMPEPVSEEFLQVQDAYLQGEAAEKGVTDLADLTPIEEGIYLWQGDITTLKCDAIVNAANSQMLGCFIRATAPRQCYPHLFRRAARAACADLMKEQGHSEPTGTAKITPAYNLPCRYVLHTVGPIITGVVTKKDEQLLASCYRSCLELAEQNQVESIAFCCISTGEFHFPNKRAAEIAVKTVREYRRERQSKMEVIFNVFKETDLRIYRQLLG